jgi:hypothetical protein
LYRRGSRRYRDRSNSRGHNRPGRNQQQAEPHLGDREFRFYDEPEKNVVFVDDGLARGAAVMARCMNSMGTPKNPLGGLRQGRCILKQRMDYELKRGQPTLPQAKRSEETPPVYYKGGQP